MRGFVPARILYHKRRRLPRGAEAELGLTYAPLSQVVAEGDFLCNLLPYSAQTDSLLDAERLVATKPGAFLVSCGGVIDEAALAEALRQGHLAGAALDTFEWGPIRPDNPLPPLARDPARNVVLTPHTAGGSGDLAPGEPARWEDYENILRLLRGEPVRHRVA